jgi:hypothetical protein
LEGYVCHEMDVYIFPWMVLCLEKWYWPFELICQVKHLAVLA